jgi:ADP-ribose pyrophosphatase YjhB (NUDIX family)
MNPTHHRILWLRRPARIVVSTAAWLPQCDRGIIDDAWSMLCGRNPRLVDGPCWHVTAVQRDGHGGSTIHVVKTTYRMGAVRTLGIASGFRGLGVKAIAHLKGRCLIGRRAMACATYPGAWEFAPGGSAEPGEDPSSGIIRELMEECAVAAASPARQQALLFDQVAGNWEIVHDIELAGEPDAPPNWEYMELRMVDLSEMPSPLSPCTEGMREIAVRVMQHERNPR